MTGLQRRVAALERLLPFFRIAPDEDVIAIILEETNGIPVAEFEQRAAVLIRRGDHAGNVIAQLLAPELTPTKSPA